jgi:hypothetical protein
MRRQQAKQCETWRCRREQYLRESGRHVQLIKEGYASAEFTTNWTVVIGGRAGSTLERNAGMSLFLVKEGDLHVGARCKEINGPPDRLAPPKGSRGGGR